MKVQVLCYNILELNILLQNVSKEVSLTFLTFLYVWKTSSLYHEFQTVYFVQI